MGADCLQGDTLANFPQLDAIDVIAGDGHLLSAACHAPRDPEGRKVGFQHGLHAQHPQRPDAPADRRSAARDATVTSYHPCGRHLPEFLKDLGKGRRRLRNLVMLLDMAYNDTAFWSRMKYGKEAGAKVIMPQKSNLETICLKEVNVDRNDPVNTGVVSTELVAFNHPDSSTMNRVIYRDPETGIGYFFLTTAMDLPPGLVALLYLLRWRIEKVLDVLKNKLHEKKAWSFCQQVQSHVACLAHNLIVILAAGLKKDYGIEPVKLHRKREKALRQREEQAVKNGRSVNPLLKLISLLSQLSCQFISLASKRHRPAQAPARPSSGLQDLPTYDYGSGHRWALPFVWVAE